MKASGKFDTFLWQYCTFKGQVSMASSFLCLPLFSVILNKNYLRDNNVPRAKGNFSPQVVDSLRTKQTSDVITMT